MSTCAAARREARFKLAAAEHAAGRGGNALSPGQDLVSTILYGVAGRDFHSSTSQLT